MIRKLSRLGICFCLALTLVLSAMVSGGMSYVRTVRAASDQRVMAIDPSGSSDGYSAVLFDNTNGLPTSEANAIAETPDGFIWIGSYSGLIRYDGKNFDRIDSTTGIASVVSLFVDSKARLWIGTNDNGVAVMEKGAYRIYNYKDGIPSSSVRSIIEDKDGTIYVATTNGIVKVDSEGKMSLLNDAKVNSTYIRQMKKGDDGTIYGVTNNGSVFTMIDGGIRTYYVSEQLGVPEIRTILPDPQKPGCVYVGTSGSEICHIDLNGTPTVDRTIDVSPLEYINSLDIVGDTVWVCADNGLSVVRNGNMTMLGNLPLTSSVECTFVDYQGNMWVASSKQGVMKIVPNIFTDIFEKYKLSTTVVNSVCMYDDMLFIGGKNSGLTVVGNEGELDSLPLTSAKTASGAAIRANDLIAMLDGVRIRSIVRDSKGALWIATFGENALLKYEDGAVIRFDDKEGLPSDRVRTVVERNDGTFLAVCTGGVAVIDGDTVTEVYGENAGIENTEILTAAEGSGAGDFVLGTDGGGIYVVSQGRAVHVGLDSGLYSEVILRITKDTINHVYWVVTSNSIAYMTDDYQITTVTNFPYSNNFDVYVNSKGKLWILSSNGIYVVDGKQMLENGEITPEHYGIDNGLLCIPTANSYSDLTESGVLYVAGTTGAVKVDVENASDDSAAIKLAVPCVEADGKQIFVDDSGNVTIPSGTRKLTIYSYAFNYAMENPEITYRLEGFDSDDTTVKRSELVPIDYTNLSGGEYQFVMKLAGESDEPLTITIIKEKAMYELLWFRLACVGAGLLLILLAVGVYNHRKTVAFRKKDKEQKLLIREIVEAFAKVIDMKDKYTNGHSTRVAKYTVMLAQELGYDKETVERFYNIALMHDIGKVGVPPEVLNKPGKLTDDEFKTIKSHTVLGYDALKGISIMPELAIGAGSHHERPDGRGYPKGLKGDEIPRVAQIIAVADTFDAMYSNRPYRKRMNFEKAVSIIKEVRGTQLQSDVVDAFLRLVDKGKFRAPDDFGGGTTEDINNIHKKQNEQEKQNGGY